MRIAAIYSGAAAHHRALNEPKYAQWVTGQVYLPELPTADLSPFDCLVIPERLHRGLLQKSRRNLLQFLDQAGTLVIFGDQSVYGDQPCDWLPGIDWVDRPVNYWWWRDPNASSGLSAHHSDHSLWSKLDLTAASWHQHGAFRPPPGAQTLVTNAEGLAILYIDQTSTTGRLIVAALDPMYHFGSFFMPATERFLDGFLPWLAQDLPSLRTVATSPE